MIPIDWNTMFTPTVSLIEIFLRGTTIYFAIFILLRMFRRGGGGVTMADVLLIVLIADASQNAMASEYRSITEGIVLILTLAFWDWFLDWAAFHSKIVSRLIEAPPLLLIKNGRLMAKNLRAELISRDEMSSQIRLAGIDDISEVKACYLENNGHFAFIKYPKTS